MTSKKGKIALILACFAACAMGSVDASSGSNAPPNPVGIAGRNGFPANRWALLADFGFNGSSINSKHWVQNWEGDTPRSITHGFQPIYDQNCFNPNNDFLAGGILTLEARSESCIDADKIHYRYSGGMISSSVSGTYSYGYFEARILFPGGKCVSGDTPPKQASCIFNHPAFWLTSANVDSGRNTVEIDIAEGLQGKICELIHLSNAPEYHDPNTMNCSTVGVPTWHVYGALWSPGMVRFYLDGNLVYTRQTPPQFKNPVYIIINNAVPTKWQPIVPAGLEVAYVRVWKVIP